MVQAQHTDISTLKAYINALPASMPLPEDGASVLQFLDFSLDNEWIEDAGEEAAINCALKVAFKDYLPRNDKGIFYITHRGPALSAFAEKLEQFISRFPDNLILKKWLVDGVNSVAACLKANGALLPAVSINTLPTSFGSMKQTLLALNQKSKAKPAASTVPATKKPDSKLLQSEIDKNYVDIPEPVDSRKGGRRWNSLLMKATQLCYHVDKPDTPLARSTWDPVGFTQAALLALKKSNKELSDELQEKWKKMMDHEKCSCSESSASSIPQPMKHLKTLEGTFSDAEVVELSKISLKPGMKSSNGGLATMFQTEGRKQLKDKVNRALVEMVICCGIPLHNLTKDRFKEFATALSSAYVLPSKTTFETSLVPKYAANARILIHEHLQKFQDLTLTFDGGMLSKKKFYSVHAMTPNGKAFCLDLDDASHLSQTADYIIGTISQLHDLLTFMSLSTYTYDHYKAACSDLGITHGFQWIGKTRFATIFWSVDSMLKGIDALKQIARNTSLGIESEIIHSVFDDDDITYNFQWDLKLLHAVLAPSSQTTPADVYVFWLAVVAQLQDIIVKDDLLKSQKYSRSVKSKIRQIVNYRFSQLIENENAGNVYLTAFVLDPANRLAPILTNPNPLAIPKINIRTRVTPSIKPKATIEKDILLSLQVLLKNEFGAEYNQCGHTVEDAKAAMELVNPRLSKHTPMEALA
ncbi:hypothetical protein BDQ17DRAFT_1394259 [Cyathus striatus]|nr:hypothetical protein BDQ17DRAFT_1394259 [Cyathus striatus]